VVFRSRGLRGPYLPWDKNPILTQRGLAPDRAHPVTSAGHADLIQTQNGDWWATFLAIRPYAPDKSIIGRETFLLPVTWQDGWPVILQPGKPVPYVVTRPVLPAGAPRPLQTSGDFSYVDEFKGSRLSLPWIGIRTPKQPFYHLGAGALDLDATVPLGDTGAAPAFIGRRLQHAVATISTTLHFSPDRDGARAGLAAVQSDRSWLFFGITRIGGRGPLRSIRATRPIPTHWSLLRR
jgi:alpha-N-arabinofuranosidase